MHGVIKTCGWCGCHFRYTPNGNAAFCESCIDEMNGKSAANDERNRRIEAGDPNVPNQTKAERERIIAVRKAAHKAVVSDDELADMMGKRER